jgi:hypothetical protein
MRTHHSQSTWAVFDGILGFGELGLCGREGETADE